MEDEEPRFVGDEGGVVGRSACLSYSDASKGFHGWREQSDKHKWVELPVGASCACGQRRWGYCPDCGEHLATEDFSEGAMAYVHGDYERLCACCVVKRQIKFAEDAIARLPELRAALIAARCRP